MKSVFLLQMEDRRINYLDTFLRHNKQTCEQHHIHYGFVQKSQFHMPSYWRKIYELDRCMKQHPNIDYFMWLDSDALLTNVANLQPLLKKYRAYSMIITGDMPPWSSPFNAGAFIVKNNAMGRRIVQEWIAQYNPTDWIYKNSKWKTPYVWAGDAYEQGAFTKHILHHPHYAKHIVTLPFYVLNNPTCDHHAETISVHLAGGWYHPKVHSVRVKHCIRSLTRKRR